MNLKKLYNIDEVLNMLKISYSKKFDKLVKSELELLNITSGAEILDGKKIILEVSKYPSKSDKLNYKTDWKSVE